MNDLDKVQETILRMRRECSNPSIADDAQYLFVSLFLMMIKDGLTR